MFNTPKRIKRRLTQRYSKKEIQSRLFFKVVGFNYIPNSFRKSSKIYYS